MRLIGLLSWLVPALASAQDVTIGDARAFLSSESALVLDETPIYVGSPVVVRNGPVTATLASGYVVPIHGGDGEGPWVGFVWVRGAAEVDLAFPEPANALRFAMRMVHQGAEPGPLRPIVYDGAPYETTADEGFVLGATADVMGVLEAYRAARAAEEADSDLVVTVLADRVAILGEARRLFERRMQTWDHAQVDVAELVAIDRMRRELYGSDPDGNFVLTELHTATAFPLEDEERVDFEQGDIDPGTKRLKVVTDPWLTTLRDDTGEWDTRYRVDAFTLIAYSRENVVRARMSGEVFPALDPTDPVSPPAPPIRLVGDFADSTLRIVPRQGDALRVDVQVESRLVFRAEGANSIVRLDVPRGITDKGTPVDIALSVGGRDVVLTLPDEDRLTTTMALPRTYADGEEVVVDARFTAIWSLGSGAELQYGSGYIEDVSAGVSSGVQSYIPMPGGSFSGNPWRFRTKVGVLASEKLTVALAGKTERTWTEPTYEWIEAAHEEGTAVWPDVAIGRWNTQIDPPHEDLPGVRVHLFTGQRSVLKSFAPEIRRDIVFFKGFLPPFPFEELEVFEDVGMAFGYVWMAPHGMVQVRKAFVFDDGTGALAGASLRHDAPHMENGVLAHEVAHQYWGHVARPPNARDFWVTETFAEGFACMYVAAAFDDPKACKVRMKAKREYWERDLRGTRVRGSLTDAALSPYRSEIVYGYGPYVMFEMLQRRIGTAAFFGALDGMLRDRPNQPITTEALQAYFEATSEMDLDDFFLFWVHGGFVPTVEVNWWKEPQDTIRTRLVGKVTTDVPFGTFDLPLRVSLGDGTTRDVWVTVVDGTAEFRTESFREPKGLDVDPDHVTLLRARKASRGKP